MSTEQTTQQVDQKLVDETRHQIRALVNEVSQLAKSDIAPNEFYGQFMERVVSALAAIGGAWWTIKQGQIELSHQINLPETRLGESEERQRRHGLLLQQAVKNGQASMVPPQSGAGDDNEAGNPTDNLILLGPVKHDDEVLALIEVFQRPGARVNTQRGYMRFVEQMCELAAGYLKTHQLRHFTDRQALWGQLESFTREVHKCLDPREAAYTIANEGRRLVDCDRVSVAIKRGRKCYIEAVSGQDTFDKRSNTIQLLNRLSTAVAASGDDVWYTGDTSDMAPQVEDAIEEYVDESHSKTVAILPLARELLPVDEDDVAAEEHVERETIGAVIVERIEDARLPEGMKHRVEVVRDHSSTALSNALQYNNLFLMPVWRTLGNATSMFRGRRAPKTALILSLVVAAVLALIFVPAELELEGDGALQPELRHNVFSTVDGTIPIDGVLVEEGQDVRVGQVVVQMESNPMEVDLAKARGDLAEAEAELVSTNGQLAKALSSTERSQIRAEVSVLQKRVRSLAEVVDLLEKQSAQLAVKCPAAGQIVTWDVKNKLRRRPVQRGQVLMTVADPGGPWELEVKMPENRMGHITEALAAAGPDNKLSVEYILATEPGHKMYGKLEEVHRLAEASGEEGNTVLLRVSINKQDIQKITELRPGAGVKARVQCGKRAVGYVWLHDVMAFIQSRILFKF